MMENMKTETVGRVDFIHDITTIRDAGYDRFMNKSVFADSCARQSERYVSARNISGGIIGAGTNMYLGSKLFRFDGKNTRQLVNDGATNRIVIGKLT